MKKILLAVLILGLISISFLLPRLFSKEQQNIFNIGKIGDFPKGSIKFIISAKAFVIADKEGIYAISAVCTHRGCLIKEGKGVLRCPCHAAQFNTTGKVTSGPARDNLAWYLVQSDKEGKLTLNTSKIMPTGTKLKRILPK
ncbi:MAG: Rieske (2Fe-2S) protein [Candidatus Omnitrophota bacterium]|nr:Rieske (2Fe-2S) protein [Candidatus Omnitrophota bacterium]